VAGKDGGFLRNNAFLVAAVSLPIVVVAFFLLASAIPRWTVPPPQHDLVFRVGKPYNQPPPQMTTEFTVRDGQLEATVRRVQPNNYAQPWSLFVFEHQTLTAKEVPFTLPSTAPAEGESQTLVVDALAGRRIVAEAKAPDGYELRNDSYRGGPGLVGDLFGMRRYDTAAALVNNGRVVPIKLPSEYQYYLPVTAIGWLTDSRQP